MKHVTHWKHGGLSLADFGDPLAVDRWVKNLVATVKWIKSPALLVSVYGSLAALLETAWHQGWNKPQYNYLAGLVRNELWRYPAEDRADLQSDAACWVLEQMRDWDPAKSSYGQRASYKVLEFFRGAPNRRSKLSEVWNSDRGAVEVSYDQPLEAVDMGDPGLFTGELSPGLELAAPIPDEFSPFGLASLWQLEAEQQREDITLPVTLWANSRQAAAAQLDITRQALGQRIQRMADSPHRGIPLRDTRATRRQERRLRKRLARSRRADHLTRFGTKPAGISYQSLPLTDSVEWFHLGGAAFLYLHAHPDGTVTGLDMREVGQQPSDPWTDWSWKPTQQDIRRGCVPASSKPGFKVMSVWRRVDDVFDPTPYRTSPAYTAAVIASLAQNAACSRGAVRPYAAVVGARAIDEDVPRDTRTPRDQLAAELRDGLDVIVNEPSSVLPAIVEEGEPVALENL